jgi:MscS family membrane protein
VQELFHTLEYTFLGIPLSQIGLSLLCIAGGFVLRIVIRGFIRILLHHAQKTDTAIDDVVLASLAGPLGAMCIVLGLWSAVELLPIPTQPVNVYHFLHAMLKAATEVIAIWFVLRLNERGARHAHEKALATQSPLADFVPLARKSVRVILIIVGGLVVVQELGYSVTSLIAGLGLGGLAIGLAAKDTLANFFGSVVIFVDRPFQRGDWITVGQQEGIVEDISVRVTRIRTFQDSLVTLPNALLTTTSITNWTRMRKRRIRLVLPLDLTTSAEQIETAGAKIRALILKDERLQHDDLTVALQEFGAGSLNVLVVCYTVTADYDAYVATQQALMLAMLRVLKELKIALSSPVQPVH